MQISRRERGFEALARLARNVTASLELPEVVDSVARAATDLLPDSFAAIWVVEGDRLVIRSESGSSVPRPPDGKTVLALGESLSGRVAFTREPLFVEDVLADQRPENTGWIRQEGFVSYLGLPLLVRDRLVGVLSFLTRRPHRFRPEEQEILAAFGTQAAIAIENARLHSETARSGGESQALLEVAGLVSSMLEVGRVLDVIVERARALLGVRAAGIFRAEPSSGLLVYERGLGLSQEFVRSLHIRVGEGTSGKALRDRSPAWSADLLNDPAVPLSDETRALVTQEGYRAALSVPILVKDQPYGVLAVYWWEPHVPVPAEVRLLTALGAQAAIAIQNAQLFEEERAREVYLSALLEINKKVGVTRDTDLLLAGIAEEAAKLLLVDNAGFRLVDGEELVLAGVYGAARETMFRPRIKVGESMSGTVVAEGRPLIADIESFAGVPPEHLAADRRLGYTTFLGVPLRFADRIIGVLTFRSRGAFTRRDIEVAEAFAGQAAIALENARLYREAREHGERLRALNEVNRLVSSSLQVEEVLKNIAQAVSAFFEAPQAHVWVADRQGQRLRRSVIVGDPAVAAGFAAELPEGDGGVGWVAQHREPILWTDLEQDDRVRARHWALRHGLRYFTAYPIMLGDRVLGAIVMYRPAPALVTPETRSLLGSLAAQAAVALDHARLYDETSRRLQETRALLEVAQILNFTLDSKALLKQITKKAAQVCQVDRCTIRVWEGDRTVPVMSQFADGRRAPELWAKFMAMPSPTREVPAYTLAIETKKPVVIPDASLTDLMPREWIETFRLKACLVVPLIRRDKVVGVMNLDYTDRPGGFEPSQVDLAVTIAGQVALALENARLLGETRERLRETEALLAVGQALSRTLPVQEAMRQVAREVAQVFQADMVGAYFLDERKEALIPMAGYHVPKDLLPTFLENPIRIDRFPLLQEEAQTGRPVWTADAMADPRFDQGVLGAIRPRALLFAPTRMRGEVVGGLFLVWWSPGRTFSPAELRLIEGVASQVGLALENADLARRTEEKLRQTEALLRVSRALSSTLELEPLLRQFLREVARTIECDSVGVWMLNPATGQLEPFAGYRIPPHLLEPLRRVRIDARESAFHGEGVATRRVMVSTHVAEDPRVPESLKLVAPHRTQLFVPIVTRDRLTAAFIAVWWDRAREFSQEELALLEAIGGQAGVAIDNARLFQAHRRKVEELSVLHEVSRAVTGQLDVAELVRAIHRQVERVLEARNMLILLHDKARGEIEVVLRRREGLERPGGRYPFGEGLISRILEHGMPIRTDNYAEECRRQGVKAVEDSLSFPYWLGVPMMAAEEAIGGLIVRSVTHPFSADDEGLLMSIAGLAALAFRSARLYEERTRAYGELAAAQDQLVRTEKLRALGEMASGVAHDFNNLLTAILGRTELLLRGVADPRLRQPLELIERAALDGAKTVRRIQEFARVRRDQPLVAVALNQVVEQALEVTQARWEEEAQSRGVRIEVKRALADVPVVSGDPVELREALTNLILNAVDAMPDGGTLTLATRAEGETVTVSVGDTGVGMSEEIQRRIFDPFFTTKGPKGTGLGLSMTYGIVSRHGGQIRVESAAGKGSTFSLGFPVGRPPTEGPRPPSPPPVSSLRCLVVDDEAPVLEILGDLLAMGGHSVVVASDGAEAIRRFMAEPFDLVITDLAMPGVNGWQVARAVKDQAPSVPVLLVTGWGVELSPEELRNQGVDAVLAKPVRLDDILRTVASYGLRGLSPRSN